MQDLKNFRPHFPIFNSQPDLKYLDTAATALKPQRVIDAMNSYYSEYSANVHRGLYRMSGLATEAYEASRETVRGFVHAQSAREIIFTRGATEAINLVARTWGAQTLKRGDEILLTILEHHSNIVPWQMLAKEKGLQLKYLDCNDDGTLKIEDLSRMLTRRTKLFSLAHISNALGTATALRPIIQKAFAVGAKVLVDAAQSAAHLPIDVQYLNCDFLVFSGHKLYGPTGIGVLYAKEKILSSLEPYMGGGDMIREVTMERSQWNDLPWKFEAGTPAIAEAIGLGETIKFIQSISMEVIRRHERVLGAYAFERLKEIPDVIIYGSSDPEAFNGIISFNIKGIHAHDVAALLDLENIAIRAGHHCCMPLMERLKVPATARISFGIYNMKKDIDALVNGLQKVILKFGCRTKVPLRMSL